MKNYLHPSDAGHAMITMLYVVVIGLLVTTGAAYAMIANTQSTTTQELGAYAYSVAESGVENAILRVIRNPAYTGETLVIDADRTAVVSVSTASGVNVISAGTYGAQTRRIEVQMHYNGGVLVFDSWKELP